MVRWVRSCGALVAIMATVALSGCVSTSIQHSWTAPDAGPIEFSKTLVVFMDSDIATRRAAEDQLVRRIGADRAQPSYTIFPEADVSNADESAARAKVRAEGFDGAVVLRLIAEDQRLSYSPGMAYPSYYGGFYGFYGYGWGMAYSPGYLRSDTIVSVETNVYSLADDDKLIFSGVTETLNQTSVRNMVDEIADVVSRELRKQRLIR